MFRLSKTTDYGIVLMAQLASDFECARELSSTATPDALTSSSSSRSNVPRESQNARELARSADLPVPMVSKILKALAREGLLHSHRGAKGGYSLARAPEDLPVAEMIRVLEGPVALTDCAIGPALCEHETMCAVREPWQQISRVVERALADVTLADLVRGGTRKHAEPGSPMLQIDRNPSAATQTVAPRNGPAEAASGRKPEPTLEHEA